MLEGFRNIFTQQAPAAQTPAAQPATPAPSGEAAIATATPAPEHIPVATPGTDKNGAVPPTPETLESPLDQFKELWQTNPDDTTNQEFAPEALDSTKLQEIISKTNMTSVITPEIQARINAGGEDAQAATMEAMNLVAQQTLMQSTTVANKMVESQVSKAMEHALSKIPGLVKEQGVNNAMHESNTVYSNPAVAPVIDAVKSQLQLKNPNATATELTEMSQNFVKAMSEALNPAPTTPSALDAETDWSNFENQ